MPRIAPVTSKADVSPEHEALVDEVLRVFGRIPGPHSVLLHSPGIEPSIIVLSEFFRGATLVQSPLRELAAITVAREKDSRYVWAAQVSNARRAGLGEEAIAAIGERRALEGLSADEKAVVAYVQQLLRSNRVEDETFEALKQSHDAQWLVELTTLVGFFGLLCGIANAFELPAPDDGARLTV